MCPGIVDQTGLSDKLLEDPEIKKLYDELPKLKPDDVARAVWYMIDQPCTVNVII